MMSCGMSGWMIWSSISAALLLGGFAYVVWAAASTQKETAKTVGQVLAWGIAVVALVVLLYHGVYGGLMGKGMKGCCMMQGGMMQKGMMMDKGMMK